MRLFKNLTPQVYEKDQEEWRPGGIHVRHIPMLEKARIICANKTVELKEGYTQDQFFEFIDNVAHTKILHSNYTSNGVNYVS